MNFTNFDATSVVDQIRGLGAARVAHFLRDADCITLCQRLSDHRYERARSRYGSANVEQDYDHLPHANHIDFLIRLQYELTEHLQDHLLRLRPLPLMHPLAFRDISVQRYAVGSRGIGMHKDHIACKNLVALITIQGCGDLVISTQREGGSETAITLQRGDLALLSAEGFRGEKHIVRPFHAIQNIRAERISLGFRDIPPGVFLGHLY